MLQQLRIQNFAIVEDLEVSFAPGLNIITGETGAGKSIVIEAIGLLRGEAGGTEIIRQGARKTVVEGVFHRPDPSVIALLSEPIDLTDDDETMIVRREVSDRGRSRAFLNDSPVKIGTLKLLAQGLMDLHGQHQHQSLLRPDTYYGLLDSFGGAHAEAAAVADAFRAWQRFAADYRAALADLEAARKAHTLAQYQLEEIARVKPQPGEDATLEQDVRLAANLERVVQVSQTGVQRLLEGDESAGEILRETLNDLTPLISVDEQFSGIQELLEGALSSVEEAVAALRKYSALEEFRPEVLEASRERLSALATLKRKYHRTLEEILALQDTLESDTGRVATREAACERLEHAVATALRTFTETSFHLSETRSRIAERMGPAITEGLRHLGMAAAEFRCTVKRRQSESGNITIDGVGYMGDAQGIDEIAFLIRTNPGEAMQPLARIASGGEISRVMLAIKTALARHDRIPLLIFDEIDIGISGRVARVVGEQLLALSEFHQILCVTHLPQIASLGNRHYVAQKESRGERVYSTLRQLDDTERREEIAKLLGGERVTAAALESARELLSQKPEKLTRG